MCGFDTDPINFLKPAKHDGGKYLQQNQPTSLVLLV